MAYRTEHSIQFISLHNKMQIKLDIARLNYKRLPKDQACQYDAVTVEDLEIGNDNKFVAIRGRRISTRVIGWKGFSLATLYSENPRKYRIDTSLNGSLSSRSYLIASQSDEPYIVEPYSFDLAATVGFGDLKDIPYLDAAGTAYQAKQSASEVLLNCLDLIGLELPTWVVCESYAEGMDESVCSLSQTIIDPTRYYPNDEPMTAYQVLQDLCTLFGAFICQSSGVWKFIQVEQLKNDSVRVFSFEPNRYSYGYSILSTAKVIAAGAKVEDKPFIRYDQRIGMYDSLKLLQMEVDYGDLKNRIPNARFQITDPTITGGVAPRYWRPYKLTYSLVTPEKQTVFKDKYLKIEGSQGAQDYRPINLAGNHTENGIVGLTQVWGDATGGVQRPVGPDDVCIISQPFVARYDQLINLSGEFFNIGNRGAKVQLIATPLLNKAMVGTLAFNPGAPLRYSDEAHLFSLFWTTDGEWRSLSLDDNVNDPGQLMTRMVSLFENTKEVRETSKQLNEIGQPMPNTDKLVTISKGEWSNFSIETTGLPLADKKFYKLTELKINGTVYERFDYYCIRVVLFRAIPYEEAKPKVQVPSSIQFRNLKAGVRFANETADIRKERHELEQDKPFGIKRDAVTIPLGSVGGENCYSQLLDLQGNPRINWYKTGKKGDLMPLPALTLQDILTVSGRPTKRITGSVLHTNFDLMDSVRPGGIAGKFMLAGATQNFPSEESQVVLAQLYEHLASHNRRYYTIDANGKVILQSEVYVEGDIPDEDATLRITFLEPNGRSNPQTQLRVTGAFPGGYVDLYSHDAYIAWFDSEEAGPYTVTVSSLTTGQGVDYLKTYPGIEGNFAKIEVPEGIIFRVTVANETAKASRNVYYTKEQRILFAEPTSACRGDQPLVIGNLGNAYLPIVYSGVFGSGELRKRADYTLEVVNLVTGEVVAGTTNTALEFDNNTAWFEAALPENWQTGFYGIRVIGKSLTTVVKDDQCGFIMEIKRCAPQDPNFYSTQYGKRYKKKEAIA